MSTWESVNSVENDLRLGLGRQVSGGCVQFRVGDRVRRGIPVEGLGVALEVALVGVVSGVASGVG